MSGRFIMKKHAILFFMFTYISLFILTPVTSKACTVQEVLEAHSTLPRSVVSLSEIQGQDLTSNQLCLIETLFEKYALDHQSLARDLNPRRAFEYIISYPVDDLQAQVIAAVITTANPYNDIRETNMIQVILYGKTESIERDLFKRVFFDVNDRYTLLDAEDIPDHLVPYSFSPEKVALIEFVLERANDNNYYNETSVIYEILITDQVDQQDVRNVKIALLTAGRDFSPRQSSYRRGPFGGRTGTVRVMLHTNSDQLKNLIALVAALEHPNNRVAEGSLIGAMVRRGSRDRVLSEEEYQCSVNALHAYLAPGRRGKSRFINVNLGRMFSSGCLGDPYFDRSYFHHYDIEATLDEALVTLEAGREVSVPYQCVGNPCP